MKNVFKRILVTIVVLNFAISCQEGCLDPNALNYNPTSNTDDGSCLYPGCIDSLATNYDPTANLDDGTCIFGGCTVPIGLSGSLTAHLTNVVGCILRMLVQSYTLPVNVSYSSIVCRQRSLSSSTGTDRDTHSAQHQACFFASRNPWAP